MSDTGHNVVTVTITPRQGTQAEIVEEVRSVLQQHFWKMAPQQNVKITVRNKG